MTALYRRADSKIYWTAWRDEKGKLYRKSTKCRKRADAEQAAKAMTDAFRRRKVSAHVREVCLEFHREVTGEVMPETSLRAFAQTWLTMKRGEVSVASYRFYDGALKRLLEHLGHKANADLNFVTKHDIVGFRDALAAGLSPATSRHLFKATRMLFRAARMDGLISHDPAESVKFTRKADPGRKMRRPFTLEEISAVLAVCDAEWRSMVLFGLHTGQRLGDLVRLSWSNINMSAGTLHLVTRKTGARLTVPLSGDLLEALAAMPLANGRSEDTPLFPNAWRTIQRSGGRVASLSNAFVNILASVGLRDRVQHKAKGKGRDAARDGASVSFHSLRHSAVSLLKAAGVPDATVMALVGHETVAMAAHDSDFLRVSMWLRRAFIAEPGMREPAFDDARFGAFWRSLEKQYGWRRTQHSA